MKKTIFQLKQFSISQDKCAMKVGTDAILLGATVPCEEASHILDIGTGTGIIALMLAQRSKHAMITGIDILPEVIEQAQENMAKSPWHDRVQATLVSAQILAEQREACFDWIVSNPPYHTEQVKSPQSQRDLARHTDSLPFSDLLSSISRLLTDDGKCSVILPVSAAPDFILLALPYHLFLYERLTVYPRKGKGAKRVVLTFSKQATDKTIERTLYIEESAGVYSEEYIALTRAFYWKM